jgi:DNA-directed RNA polymerase delta subunit
MASVYTVGEISNNNIKIYTEQGWKMTSVYTVGEISNNNNIYTEQGWKMRSVYTVGEISNKNIKIYTEQVGRWQVYILLER